MGKFKQQEGRIKHNRINRSNNRRYYAPDPNKSDEDIVNESIHLLHLEIDKLLINSKETRRYERLKREGTTDFENPPRPQNSFMLYRRNKSASPEFKNKPKKDKKVKDISKEIATDWKKESEEVLKFFWALGRMAEKKHKEIYGDGYKQSRKPKNKKELTMASYSSSRLPTPQTQTSQSSTLDELPYLRDAPQTQTSQSSTLDELPYLRDDDSQSSTLDELPYLRDDDSQPSLSNLLFDEYASSYPFNDITQFSTNSFPSDPITPSTQCLTNSFVSVNNNTQHYIIYGLSHLLYNIETGETSQITQMYYPLTPNLGFDHFGLQQINDFLHFNSLE